MFPRAPGSEVETADENVVRLHQRLELRVVVLHHDFGLLLGLEVVDVGVFPGVDAVRIQVVLMAEYELSGELFGKSLENRDRLRRFRSACHCVDRANGLWRVVASRPGDLSRKGRSCNHGRRGEVGFGGTRTHAPFEIPIGGGDTDFTILQESGSQPDARAATGGKHPCSGVDEVLPIPSSLAFRLYLVRGGGNVKLYALRDFFPANNIRRRGEIIHAAVDAGDEVGLVDDDALGLVAR